MDELILFDVYEKIKNGEKVALAMLTSDVGSSPRKAGAYLAVFEDESFVGTVGGGKVELNVINKAKEALKNNKDIEFEYGLNEKDLGMQCGGEVKGFIKVFNPKPRLLIAGAGHIGKVLNNIAQTMKFNTVIFDDRDGYEVHEDIKSADKVIIGNIEENLKNFEIRENDYVVIVTKGHINDMEALRATAESSARYVGMIGSQKKIKYVMEELEKEGISKEALDKVYAPTGLDIAARLPEEIAISILSEIILIKNNGRLQHKRNLRKF